MKNIFLITEKLNKTKQLQVYGTEKDVFKHFSPRANHIELIEKVEDALLDKRLEFWAAQHGIEMEPVDIITENGEPKKRYRPSGLKYKITKKDRKARSKRMKENNPNKDGLRPQQIEAIRKAATGNQWAKGHKKSEETKAWMSLQKSLAESPLKGYRWIFNPTTQKEQLIPGDAPIPDGFRYGRNEDIVENAKYYSMLSRSGKSDWS